MRIGLRGLLTLLCLGMRWGGKEGVNKQGGRGVTMIDSFRNGKRCQWQCTRPARREGGREGGRE